ncbi:MAG: hypothetical protein ABIQ88_03890 [Chitinophagaceae bacterium]
MKKWFLAFVNLLLGAFVVLIIAMQRNPGSANYNEITTHYIPRILLSFGMMIFFVLVLVKMDNGHSNR